MSRRPPRSTLSPYTTLFRSALEGQVRNVLAVQGPRRGGLGPELQGLVGVHGRGERHHVVDHLVLGRQEQRELRPLGRTDHGHRSRPDDLLLDPGGHLVEEFQRHPVQFGGLTVLSEEEERVDLVAFARELHGTLEVRTSVGAAEGDHHSVPADFVRYQVEAAQVVPIELLDAHALVLELVGGQVLRVCVALAAESPPVDQAHPDDDQHQHHEGGQCPEQEATHASHGERLRRVRSARPVTGVIDEAVHCHASSGRTAPSQRLDASSTVIIPTWRSSASSCSTLAWCSGRSSAVASVTTWARTLLAKASRAVWAIQACVDTPASSTVSTPRFPSRSSRRSEEHTSELQSRGHLVCRLLLEKKKKKITEY